MTDPSPIERAVFGAEATGEEIDARTAGLVRAALGAEVRRVVMRSGRVAVVHGLELVDGRRVAVKVHRGAPPVPPLERAQRLQARLHDAGFPCPAPLGVVHAGGLTAGVETWSTGRRTGDGRDPRVRRTLAAGLARQVALLRDAPDEGALAAPAWTRWEAGPWPEPHDPIFDFTVLRPDLAPVDEVGAAAAAAIGADASACGPPVVAHADWTCGNTAVDADGGLVGSWDWDGLARQPEAVLVGMSAASFPQGGPGGASGSSPARVDAFLRDYAAAAGRSFDDPETRTARAAALWVLAYSARCEAALLPGDAAPAPGSTLAALLADGERHLDLDRR